MPIPGTADIHWPIASCRGRSLRPTKNTYRQNTACLRKTSRGTTRTVAFQPLLPFPSSPSQVRANDLCSKRGNAFVCIGSPSLVLYLGIYASHMTRRSANWAQSALGTQRHWERIYHAFRPVGPTSVGGAAVRAHAAMVALIAVRKPPDTARTHQTHQTHTHSATQHAHGAECLIDTRHRIPCVLSGSPSR